MILKNIMIKRRENSTKLWGKKKSKQYIQIIFQEKVKTRQDKIKNPLC